jgi:hypothetical protein
MKNKDFASKAGSFTAELIFVATKILFGDFLIMASLGVLHRNGFTMIPAISFRNAVWVGVAIVAAATGARLVVGSNLSSRKEES